jgi:glycosyltransferase involved in cell wall biosynthesis
MVDLKLSIVIPCYEMGGNGKPFLERLLKTIILQDADIENFEVIVSDHSEDFLLRDTCLKFSDKLKLNYFKNPDNRGSSSANLNNAIINSNGEYIKPIFQDDFLHTVEDISIILENLNHDWSAHPYIHFDEDSKTYFNSRIPSYNEGILYGVNTIGPPTCVVFRNDENYFDENLIWFMDCEFYHRMYMKYGKPNIIKSGPISVNTVWKGQITNTLITDSVITKEMNYLKKIYKNGIGDS